MRSITKPAVALVALLALLLTGCATSSGADTFDSSEVPCVDVSAELASSKEDLSEAKTTLEDVAGTPAEVDANDAITEAQAKVNALKERSEECDQTGVAPASDTTDGIDLAVYPEDLIPAEAECDSDEFIKNSLPSTKLVYGDSVSTPFVSDDPLEMFFEYLSENCGNPTVLDQTIRGLYSMQADDTHTIGQVNAWWMDEYLEMVPADVKLREAFLIKKEDEGSKLFVIDEFSQYAELANTVLLRMKIDGVYEEQSVTNWHIPARVGLVAGEIPRPQINTVTEERLAALHLEYTFKGAACGPIRIGFNRYDKRLEIFASDCKPFTPPSSCTVNCGSNPPCTVNCGNDSKDPSDDILVNPNVPPFYLPDGEKQTATPDNYQGNQADVLAAQQAAAAAAAAEAARLAAEAEAARLAAEAEVKPEPPTGSSPQPGW